MGEQRHIHRQLMDAAKQVAKNAYAPYSHFPVGAAVLTIDERIFAGCNVENASLGGTICAERVAIAKAVSEGCQKFKSIAIFCYLSPGSWPCGICRQFISEFGIDMDVIVESSDGSIQLLKLTDLLPRHFGPESLPR